MLTLYYGANTCARASHIALAESGAAYGLVKLNFLEGEQRKPAYLAVNPKARVPALVTPQGTLTETPAILAFIAQSFPAAHLAPLDDPFAFAQLQAFNSYLCATVHVAHAHRFRGARWSDDPAAQKSMQLKVASNMRECFELIEAHMFKGPWVLGETYSVADAYLYTIASWLPGDGVDLAGLPATHAHHQRMEQRPAVQKALAEEAGAA
ncbi:glutathione S-transferase family protein [Pseudorhodoferax sp. Leaf267]|uniref:glutathione S-transferase family protein n=1 Tax=Pseudorhodoferax sp. Leaf267 TaxID=1736316 RepID=UPI0007002D6E|nr:glutathione S-transferase family protein [Pseudorhodoferax sp. Leaf267]KQP18381.1 glutathione S-transferase [Pseudorhodoferax sp. Leaf267]